ncbi:acyltransferase family protein [Entomospira entomophila]|uniref:Acyltransferase n=1 Tax=Entomospira entomophila TaxID=2719988 RepID=A0A968G8Y7_9SPIO|nr:acyltransferase family protein [Entomospira entomophilus]NIZ40176.1 acyltransferase [Entomospira entomophilus]WDI35735.1 acyltransferase family protein [Entomospira entomophilus]
MKSNIPQHSNLEYLYPLRVFATILVMLTHVVSNPYMFNKDFFLLMNAFSRVAVPIFMMITGVLFLSRSEFNIKMRVSRIVISLFVWTFLYVFMHKYIWFPLHLSGNVYGLRKLVVDIFFHESNIALHFWYLYALAGIYLVMPFLQMISKNSSQKQLLYGLILWMIFTVGWHTLDTFREFDFYIPSKMLVSVPIFAGFTGYLFLGHYLQIYKPILHHKKELWGGLLGYVMISFVMFWRIRMQTSGHPSYTSFGNTTIYLLLQAIAFFYFIRGLNVVISSNTKSHAVFKKLSSLSFVAFLVHAMVITVNHNLLIKFALYKDIGMNGQRMILWISVISFSYLISYIINKLPKPIATLLGAS